MSVNINNLFPKASWAAGSAVAGQNLSVTSTAAVQKGTEFNDLTNLVMFDVKDNTVYCTIDGTTPTASGSRGHAMVAGSNFTWSKGMASGAKFIAANTAARIFFSELQV